MDKEKEFEIVGKSKDNKESNEIIDGIGSIGVAIQKISHQLKNHEQRISNVEDTMRVSGIQEMKITEMVNRVVVGYLGGKESNAYQDKSLRGRVYSAINREIRRKFGVPRRSEVPAKDYHATMNFIESWELDYDFKTEIENKNNQLRLLEA